MPRVPVVAQFTVAVFRVLHEAHTGLERGVRVPVWPVYRVTHYAHPVQWIR